jgi:DNA-binding response OmpR family regulator
MDTAFHAATLLLAEDDDDLRQIVADALRDGGYQVIEARNEHEGTVALKQNPNIDLIVTDVAMPGEHDGIVLAERVRETNPEMPVLLITGQAFEDVALPRSAGYLAKPFGVGELLRYVESTLRSARGDLHVGYEALP